MKEDLQKLYFTSLEVQEYSGLIVDLDKPIIKTTGKTPNKKQNQELKQKRGCLATLGFYFICCFLIVMTEIIFAVMVGIDVDAMTQNDTNNIIIFILAVIITFLTGRSKNNFSDEEIKKRNSSNGSFLTNNIITKDLEKFFVIVDNIQKYNQKIKAID